jgi:uncharacterized protein
MRASLIAVFLVLLHALAFGQRTPSGSTPVIPLVDYHQHLFSPAKAATVYDAPLPAITLPAELADLVRKRETSWNNAASLAAFYTADSWLVNTFDEDAPTWLKGREKVAEEVTKLSETAYTITPVAYKISGDTASVAGYYTQNLAAGDRHFGHIFLSLVRNGGSWLIAAETPTFPGPFSREPSTSNQLIAQLDDARIGKALVLSVAYQWGSSSKLRPGEYDRVRAENDYISQQVSKYPKRLYGYCSFNPLKEYAIAELQRCIKLPGMIGLKLHFGNSRIELRNPEHVEKVRAVFAAANRLRVPILAHLWTLNPNYGREDAQLFLDKVLPAAPDIVVQIAHLAGGGTSTLSALSVYADAIAAGDRRTRNLYFDVATSTNGETAENLREDAKLIRKIGVKRILYGTDTSPPRPPARVSWGIFRGQMPLTDEEFKIIASNLLPFLR